MLLRLLKLAQAQCILVPRSPLGLARRVRQRGHLQNRPQAVGVELTLAGTCFPPGGLLAAHDGRGDGLEEVDRLVVRLDRVYQLLRLLLLAVLLRAEEELGVGLLVDAEVLAGALGGVVVLLGGVPALKSRLVVLVAGLGVAVHVGVGALRVQGLVHGLVGLLVRLLSLVVHRLAEVESLPWVPRGVDLAQIVQAHGVALALQFHHFARRLLRVGPVLGAVGDVLDVFVQLAL